MHKLRTLPLLRDNLKDNSLYSLPLKSSHNYVALYETPYETILGTPNSNLAFVHSEGTQRTIGCPSSMRPLPLLTPDVTADVAKIGNIYLKML
jgi:hypothetical protein